MSGLTHGTGALGAAVAGQAVVASVPASGPAGHVVHAAQAALPYTGIALGVYVLVAVALLLGGVVLRWAGRREDA